MSHSNNNSIILKFENDQHDKLPNNIICLNEDLNLLENFNDYLYLSNKGTISEDAEILTDQGCIEFKDLDMKKHTINGQKIISIFITKYENKKFILFKKNCLGQNIPNKDIYLHNSQEINYDNNYVLSKIFLVKYSKNVDITDNISLNLYNILLENDSDIFVNNILIKSLYSEFKLYKYQQKIISLEKKWNTLTNKELIDFYYKYGRDDKKHILHFKLTYDNADFEFLKKTYPHLQKKSNHLIWNDYVNNKINSFPMIYINLDAYQKRYVDLKNFTKIKLWEHWINIGKKEKRIITYIDHIDILNIEEYKKKYSDISMYSDKNAFLHWTKHGKMEGRIMNYKFTVENADLEQYKLDYNNNKKK